MHGRGKFFFGNGKVHTGEWVESKMHGEGELLYADGRKYVGKKEGKKTNGLLACWWLILCLCLRLLRLVLERREEWTRKDVLP